jgi:hypothetical protein
MTITRRVAAAAVLAGAAVGLASPASAEPPSGNYTATVTAVNDPMAAEMLMGQTNPATLTPCGSDCTHMVLGEKRFESDLRQQGDTWSGPLIRPSGAPCTATLNSSSLILTSDCPGDVPLITTYQLTKNG